MSVKAKVRAVVLYFIVFLPCPLHLTIPQWTSVLGKVRRRPELAEPIWQFNKNLTSKDFKEWTKHSLISKKKMVKITMPRPIVNVKRKSGEVFGGTWKRRGRGWFLGQVAHLIMFKGYKLSINPKEPINTYYNSWLCLKYIHYQYKLWIGLNNLKYQDTLKYHNIIIFYYTLKYSKYLEIPWSWIP